MRARCLLLVALGATSATTGCSTEILDVWLPLPDPGDNEAVLVAVPERSSARVFVADVDEIDDFELSLSERGPEAGPIEVAFFEAPLDEALVTPGWQSIPVAGSDARPLALGADALLGTATESFRADLTASPAAWVETEKLSNLVASYEVGVRPPTCADLHAPNVHVAFDLNLGWAIPLTETHALVSDDETGDLFVFSSEAGTLEGVELETRYTRAAARDGWIYLTEDSGQVWYGRGHPETVLDAPLGLGAPLPGRPVAIAAGGFEDVFVMLSGGEVHHFDGEIWRLVGAAPDARPRLRSIGPQRALLFSGVPNIVYIVTPAGLQQEEVAETGILSGTATDALGVVVGTSDGELIQQVDGGWRKLGDARFGWWVLDVIPFERGVAQLLASGTVSGYQPGVGDCGDQYTLHIITAGRLVPQRGGFLIVAEKSDLPITDFVMLEPL